MQVQASTLDRCEFVPGCGVMQGKEITYIFQQFSWRPVTFQGGENKGEE